LQTRVAVAGDLELLVDLGRSTFFETFEGTCTDQDMQLFLDTSYHPKKVASELAGEHSTFLIIEDSEGPAGYSRLLGESAQRVELVRFYMDKRAIGTGAAHKLMQHSLDLASERGYSEICLGVWEKNFRAQRFYEKWGFAKTCEKVFMVGADPQVDWQYERRL